MTAPAGLSLDIIMPTFNRAASLRRAVTSILACRNGFSKVCLIIVDNKSTDDTKTVVGSFCPTDGFAIRYVFEATPGQPSAINAGLRHSSADLVAFFDDDERAFPDWLDVIRKSFADPGIGFITGRYIPDWLAEKPGWLPKRRMGLVGVVDPGEAPIAIRTLSEGRMFLGGNSVARREAALKAGGYSEWLTYGNDAEYGIRLVDGGAVGRYVPALRVHHEIPPARLTKAYLRRRTMMNQTGTVRIRQRWSGIDALFLGFPIKLAYYHLVAFLRGVPGIISGRADQAARFDTELRVWDLLGLLRGWSRWDEIGRRRRMR